MKKLIAISVVGLILSGCAGKTAYPVQTQQVGDSRKSCSALERDILHIDSEIKRLTPKTEKTGKNVALGVTGAFLVVPLFFMDFSDAEQVEVNALRNRHNHLMNIMAEKGC